MTETYQSTLRTAYTLLVVGLFLGSLANAQVPSYSPYAQREAQRAYLANQRAQASVPVNYTFAVRPDLATAYNAAAYAPRYRYSSHGSLYANYPQAVPSNAYRYPSQTSYRPIATPYTAYANPVAVGGFGADPRACSLSPATASAYYPSAVTSTGREASPYYVGSSLAGPPKVYPKDQPIRNVFRYLFP